MRGSSIFFSREHPLDYFHTPPLQLSPLPPPPPKNRHEKMLNLIHTCILKN